MRDNIQVEPGRAGHDRNGPAVVDTAGIDQEDGGRTGLRSAPGADRGRARPCCTSSSPWSDAITGQQIVLNLGEPPFA